MIFSFLAIFHVLQWTFLNFPTFSIFPAIFHVLKCVFLIFRNFQFSRHIPGPSVGISHFSRFLVISSFFKSSSGCFSLSMIFSFHGIFNVLQWTFLNFPPFSVFLDIFHVLKCVLLIFRDFQFSRHITGCLLLVVVVCVCVYIYMYTCGSQRTTYRSHFSPVTIMGTIDQTQVFKLAASPLYMKPSCQSLKGIFERFF